MMEKTILLVEDNENDVFFTKRALDRLGISYRLVVACNGVEALDCLFRKQDIESKLPDLVLLDIKLPLVDGLQVLKEIRANDKTCHLKVLVVTSSSEEKDIVIANKLGVNSYSIKPTNVREYYELIQNLVVRNI